MLYQSKSDRVIRPADLGLSTPDLSPGATVLGGQLPRVLTIELCRERQVTTNGGGAGVWTSHILLSDLAGIGPAVEDLVIHAYGRSFSANFTYRVTAQKSYDGVDWTNFAAAILPSTTAAGNTISNPYTTRTDLGLHLRLLLEVSDNGAKQVGALSVTLAIRLAR